MPPVAQAHLDEEVEGGGSVLCPEALRQRNKGDNVLLQWCGRRHGWEAGCVEGGEAPDAVRVALARETQGISAGCLELVVL